MFSRYPIRLIVISYDDILRIRENNMNYLLSISIDVPESLQSYIYSQSDIPSFLIKTIRRDCDEYHIIQGNIPSKCYAISDEDITSYERLLISRLCKIDNIEHVNNIEEASVTTIKTTTTNDDSNGRNIVYIIIAILIVIACYKILRKCHT
jgi:hypothetical protein